VSLLKLHRIVPITSFDIHTEKSKIHQKLVFKNQARLDGVMQQCGQCGWPDAKMGGGCGMATCRMGTSKLAQELAGRWYQTVQYST
jgi:hypothetical protein